VQRSLGHNYPDRLARSVLHRLRYQEEGFWREMAKAEEELPRCVDGKSKRTFAASGKN